MNGATILRWFTNMNYENEQRIRRARWLKKQFWWLTTLSGTGT
jgi:hypothetical protein